MVNSKISYETSVQSKLKFVEDTIAESSRKGKFEADFEGLNNEITNILEKEGYSVRWDKPRHYVSWYR